LKKTSYIALLIVILMQSGGLLLVYKMKQLKVQFKMMQVLRENHEGFSKLTLTLAEYNQSRIKSHEISWQGRMYDVKSKVITGNSVDLLVIHDEKEENILKKIKLLAGNTSSQNRELPQQLVQLLTLTYICPAEEADFKVRDLEEYSFLPFSEKYNSIDIDILSPPPELV
jgi:hypothetical protein